MYCCMSVTGTVAALWKFLNLAQEIILLSLVNTRFVSQELVAAFQGGSFVNFDFFNPLFSLMPPEYRGQVGYNALTDGQQNHPYIFSPTQPPTRFAFPIFLSRPYLSPARCSS